MSATIQQAIEKISGQYKTAVEQYHKAIAKRFYKAASAWQQDFETLELVLTALREKLVREDPEPLTKGELWEMDGEPVYIVPIGDEAHQGAEWCIMNGDSAGSVRFYPEDWYNLDDYGKTWTAYRHKPKEEKK